MLVFLFLLSQVTVLSTGTCCLASGVATNPSLAQALPVSHLIVASLMPGGSYDAVQRQGFGPWFEGFIPG